MLRRIGVWITAAWYAADCPPKLDAKNLPCPVCGATGSNPCTSFDVIAPGVRGEPYTVAPHVWRDMAETYWRAVVIRLAEMER